MRSIWLGIPRTRIVYTYMFDLAESTLFSSSPVLLLREFTFRLESELLMRDAAQFHIQIGVYILTNAK